MTAIESKAAEVLSALAGEADFPRSELQDQAVGGSIIALIQAIIALLQSCGLGAAVAAQRAAKPRVIDRLRVHRMTRKQLRDRPLILDHYDSVARAILAAGATTTAEQMASMFTDTGATI